MSDKVDIENKVCCENENNDCGKEVYEFEAEVPQVMSIMINSVYSTKDVFLKELITNAFDSLTKMMAEKSTLEDAGYSVEPICNYAVKIVIDKKNRTVTIKDNGIGMTKTELIDYLGRIASSGTRRFREMAEKSERPSADGLVGQFGLGFYSGFLVADRIDVVTKSVRDQAYMWSSYEGQNYTIQPYNVDFLHGMEVILRLKDGEDGYLEASKIEEIVKKYSMCTKFDLYLVTESEEDPVEEKKKEEKEIEGDGAVEEINNEEETKGNKEKAADNDENKNGKKKMVEKLLSTECPVWNKKAKDMTPEELKKLYKSLSNDYDDYAAVESRQFEGVIDLNIILFIPKRAPYPLFEKAKTKNNNIKIYNAGTFVTDDLDFEVVPEWMNFVYGIVSSPNLPVNISRESIQGSGVMNILKNKLPKCVLEMLENLKKDSEKFKEFYNNFSRSLKMAAKELRLGPLQAQFAKLLMYPTNKSDTPITFDEYIAGQPEDCKQILIHTGMSLAEVKNSIYLRDFTDRTVLLMGDPNDEMMLQGLHNYKGFEFQHISASGIEKPASAEDAAKYEELKKAIEETYKDTFESVKLTYKDPSVPALIYTKKSTNSFTMERIIKLYMANNGKSNDEMLKIMLGGKRVLEINVKSPVIQTLEVLRSKPDAANEFKYYLNILYNTMMLASGSEIDDTTTFINGICDLLNTKIANIKPEEDKQPPSVQQN